MYSIKSNQNKGIVPLDKKAVDEELASLTKRGLRVVALAIKELDRDVT
jgi:hypothetical protein